MNGFIKAEEPKFLDLLEADGWLAVISQTIWWGAVTALVKSHAKQLCRSLSVSHTHTHSCIYAVIESFCYCGAQRNVFLFLSVARIPSLLCLKQRMWFFSFLGKSFSKTQREQKSLKDDKMGPLRSHTLIQSVAMVTLCVTSILTFPWQFFPKSCGQENLILKG